MPQMAPMWWTFIFLMSMISLMMMMVMNFFNFLNLMKMNSKKKEMTLNWKW